MLEKLNSLESLASLEEWADTREEGAKTSVSFGDLLGEKINDTNSLLKKADRLMTQFATGEKVSIHEVIGAADKASMALNLAIEVRNKALEAYRTVLRTQV